MQRQALPTKREPVRTLGTGEVWGPGCWSRGSVPLPAPSAGHPGNRKVTPVSLALPPLPKPRCPGASCLPGEMRRSRRRCRGAESGAAPRRGLPGEHLPPPGGGVSSPPALLPPRYRDRPVGAAGGWRRPPSDGADDAATRAAEPI